MSGHFQFLGYAGQNPNLILTLCRMQVYLKTAKYHIFAAFLRSLRFSLTLSETSSIILQGRRSEEQQIQSDLHYISDKQQ